jgi:hypothetical protein
VKQGHEVLIWSVKQLKTITFVYVGFLLVFGSVIFGQRYRLLSSDDSHVAFWTRVFISVSGALVIAALFCCCLAILHLKRLRKRS